MKTDRAGHLEPRLVNLDATNFIRALPGTLSVAIDSRHACHRLCPVSYMSRPDSVWTPLCIMAAIVRMSTRHCKPCGHSAPMPLIFPAPDPRLLVLSHPAHVLNRQMARDIPHES
ncbi:Transcriptional regulator [Pseudomonas syringae pv. viburni]|uniref:Transcriptional regulator n=1 Tax=Pseudomonas syringae pv. viburni TaxID=251703 RepID=A0A0Q0ET15_9PSED|nr:Transcriptional regulator [Pseudomonas syringae pv. viburni]